MSEQLVLHIAGLEKSYRAGVAGCSATVEVLRDVHLSLRAGQVAAVDGERGAGKTTLLMCAAGLLRPGGGSVQWPAIAPRGVRAPGAISLIGDRGPPYAFLTVREAIGYAATVRDLHDPGTTRDTESLLNLLDLRELADIRTGMLRAGERARVLLALGLVSRPQLLLVDDLPGAVDSVTRTAFARYLQRIAAEGTGVLWAARTLAHGAIVQREFTIMDGRLCARHPEHQGRATLELDVPSADHAWGLLADRLDRLERHGRRLRVPLDSTSAEEVLAVCRSLAISVTGSRVVRML